MADESILAELRAKIDDIETRGERRGSARIPDRGSQEGRVYEGNADLASPVGPRTEETAGDALKKIVALVNASDKSELAIRSRLTREGFPPDAIEEAMQEAKRYGLVDDERFGIILVQSRISQKRGSAGIRRELAENGIEADEVPGWPYEFPLSYDEELDRAISLLESKPPHSKNRREGAYRRLIQKGYPSSVASSAARIWCEQALR